MKQIFKRPESLKDVPFHFCPGCHHGLIHRLVAETIDAYNLREQTVCAASVGCSVFMYDYFAIDVCESPHGRAAAVATGIKRALPDRFVFTYQGDGDLAALGIAEGIHAAHRGEDFTIIFVNNAIYGMTGGQMAPTTLLGQTTTTSPFGREPRREGYPLRMAELMAQAEGTAFSARVAVNNPKNLMQAKKVLKRAFEAQLNKEGFSFVEFLSSCPTNWKMTPEQANRRVEQEMMPYFPLGVYKDSKQERKQPAS